MNSLSQVQAPAFQSFENFHIEKKEQSSLKGYLWTIATGALISIPPTLASMAFFTLAGTAGSLAAENSHNAVLFLGLSVATIGATAISLEMISGCAHNAMYHFGPEHEIVKN